MLAKRAFALSPDKAFAKKLAAGLQATGAIVETASSLEELPAGPLAVDLLVIHAPDDPMIITTASARAPSGTPVVAIIGSASLEGIVGAMMAGHVASVMAADTFSPARLSGVANRLLNGDLFGLDKVMPWGVKIHTILVGDYSEKSTAIDSVSAFASAMGVRRKYRESIEQCVDEMLMNALYDAPVDAAGKQTVAEVPMKDRISLQMEHKVLVQYACDGNLFALAVRDSFGTLRGETVVRYLDKCLHAEQQIDRKVGGAGLGLYIICNAATEFLVNLSPGIATEATCLFDLNASKVHVEHVGIFEEKRDVMLRVRVDDGRWRAPSEGFAPAVVPAANRGVLALLSAAVVLLFALIAVVAWPRFHRVARGAVTVTTVPAGAAVQLDGVDAGRTDGGPLVLHDLLVGQKYKVTAAKPGYETAVELVAPQQDQAAATVTLNLKAMAATFVIDSTPPGATLILDGKELGPTPVTLGQLAPNSEHQAELRKVGYQNQVRAITIPEPGGHAAVTVALSLAADVSSISIDSDPPGAEIQQNDEVLAGVHTPLAEHIVQAGKTYTFVLRLAGYMPVTKTVTVQSGAPADLSAKLKPGGTLTVDCNLADARIAVGAAKDCARSAGVLSCPVENGSYKVKVTSPTVWVGESFTVEVAGADLHKRIDLGYVVTPSDDFTFKATGAPPSTHKLAFGEGEHQVTLVDKTGVEIKRAVKISAGKTLTLPAQ